MSLGGLYENGVTPARVAPMIDDDFPPREETRYTDLWELVQSRSATRWTPVHPVTVPRSAPEHA